MSDGQSPDQSPETGPEMDIDEYLASMPQGMGALNEKMGIVLTEISAERVVGTMPVEGNTQPYGLLHGGASVVLAETLGSVGSAVHAHPDRLSVGIEINATHHRPAQSSGGRQLTQVLAARRSMRRSRAGADS
ncbi:MAG: hotdog fold thioesterase [Nocardioides sp.]|nr:hotdog fold thioesterase [Nocardioides sp.]